MNRGISVVDTFSILKNNSTLEEIKKAEILGWCVEIVRLMFIL